MSNRHIIIEKKVGESPLDAINRLRGNISQLSNETLGYAGRLDPMADGLLLILAGSANLKRKEYEKLPKTYTCKAIFGLETDSYDLLGLFTRDPSPTLIPEHDFYAALNIKIGKQIQSYPPYSSPRVNGHPLFWWAREGRLSEIIIPEKEIEIYSAEATEFKQLPLGDFKNDILNRLSKVHGEFRQEQIVTQWNNLFSTSPELPVTTVTMKITCSSGTYIRSHIYDLGRLLKSGALAHSITRSEIGSYTVKDAITLD